MNPRKRALRLAGYILDKTGAAISVVLVWPTALVLIGNEALREMVREELRRMEGEK